MHTYVAHGTRSSGSLFQQTMANNGTVYDDEVKGTLAAKLVPKFLSQGGGYQLMYKIQFNDGRSE